VALKFRFGLVVLLLSFSGKAQQMTFPFAEAEKPNTPLNVWATEYYVHVTREAGTIPFLSMEGDTLAFCETACDFCTASLEGTVFLTDSLGQHIVLNYAGRAAEAQMNCRSCALYVKSTLKVESWGSVRWKLSTGYGEGVKGYRLVPYRTIAVDPKVIPYGSVVYIPAARGTRIAVDSATIVVHDGYFFAGDTGGAIKENHIDVFTGDDDSHPFEFVKSSARHTVEAWIVEDDEIRSRLTSQHLE
jgi:3D (Asp-Asp-Asp) domain-containing protein